MCVCTISRIRARTHALWLGGFSFILYVVYLFYEGLNLLGFQTAYDAIHGCYLAFVDVAVGIGSVS